MKVSIWINNLKGQHFEITNSAKTVIDIGTSFNSEGFVRLGYCDKNDLIVYDTSVYAFAETTLQIIHKGKNEEESKFISEFIKKKIHEKSELMFQIQVLKKMKSKEIQPIIDEIKKNIHDNYFQFNISDILKEFNKGSENNNENNSR